ncbi:MAG: nitroreductase family protein [Deltaproteobacteria bacterium]|nr:nitroreductase family protein [Deltaproteobacteria bacterium]MBW2305770.1 nitroreductase family protein [Deltaproteobacteria bacterium]
MADVEIIAEKCTCCGLCAEVCIRGILQMTGKAIETVNPARCNRCGHCVAVCPEDAIMPAGMDPLRFERLPKEGLKPDPDWVLRFLRSRRSVRHYQDKPVPRPILERVLDASRYAPSGGNRQPWHIVVVQGKESLDRVIDLTVRRIRTRINEGLQAVHEAQARGEEPPLAARVYADYLPTVERIENAWKQGKDDLFYGAPVIVTIHTPDLGQTMREDASYAAMYMILMAESLGLGTLLNGWFQDASRTVRELRDFLRIPQGNQVQVGFALGYPRIRFLRLVDRNPLRVTWV